MLNEALNQSYSPAGQKSFNERLKKIEGVLNGYEGQITTDKVVAGEITAKSITADELSIEEFNTSSINTSNITSSDADISNIKFLNADGDKLNANSIIATDAELKDVTSAKIDTEDALIKNATIGSLTIENIIDKLNVRELDIDSNVALTALANTVLNIGEGFKQASIKSAERPKWKEIPIVTEDQLITPFTLKDVVEDEQDLPEDASIGDTYIIRNNGQPNIAIKLESEWAIINYPTLYSYRTAAAQDEIDKNLQAMISNNETETSALRDLIDTNKQEVEEFKEEQAAKNLELETADKVAEDEIANINLELSNKVADAPANDKLYGRKNGEWQEFSADGIYVPKKYDKKVKYFTDITITKNSLSDAGSQLIQIDENTRVFVALWKAGLKTYTTRNMYQWVSSNAIKVDPVVRSEITKAWDEGRVLGTLDMINFQTLNFIDTATEFFTEIDGSDIERPDGEVTESFEITNDENGINFNGAVVNVTTPSIESDVKAVVNREYIRNSLSLTSSQETSSAVLNYRTAQIDQLSSKLVSFMPLAQTNLRVSSRLPSDNYWMKRAKDYVYYKVDNVLNQTANTRVSLLSIDANGQIINMTTPELIKEAEIATFMECQMISTYAPEAYDGIVDNVAYYPLTRQGMIQVFNNGRYAGLVNDAGNTELYALIGVANPECRLAEGKSLRSKLQRMLIVNNYSDATDPVKALLIGIDSSGTEGIDRAKIVSLPTGITFGPNGLAAGAKHWYAQKGETNEFYVINKDGSVASYVLSYDNQALGTAVYGAPANFIQLTNGDVIFCIRDATNQHTYHIWCHDDYEETGSEPFEVLLSEIDYTHAASTSGRPVSAGYPYVEFGSNVYFTTTCGCAMNGDILFPVNTTIASSLSRINKDTKQISTITLPWTNADAYGTTGMAKTYDEDEQKDYLWVYQQNQSASAEVAPFNSTVMIIDDKGSFNYIDLGIGQSINMFGSKPAVGTQLQTHVRPLNISGTAGWASCQEQRASIPYLAVNEQGKGLMISSNGKSAILFWGNGHYKVFDYSSSNEALGLTMAAMGAGRGPALIANKYGWTFFVQLPSNLVTDPTTTSSTCVAIYIKASDDNEQLNFYVKPITIGVACRAFYRKYDGLGYARTDYTQYKYDVMRDVTPLNGRWEANYSATQYEIEATGNTDILYLKDGEDVLSTVRLS